MGFGYDVCVMISWLFSCLRQLKVLIVGFGYDVSVMIPWLFSYPMVVHLSQTARPKAYIYSVACEVGLSVSDMLFL